MKTEQEIFDELLQGFMNKIIQWSSPFSESNLKFVYNQNLDNLQFDKVKYILVGDNLGENELKQEKYLVGEAGLIPEGWLCATIIEAALLSKAGFNT